MRRLQADRAAQAEERHDLELFEGTLMDGLSPKFLGGGDLKLNSIVACRCSH
jgi:hypothetical protein